MPEFRICLITSRCFLVLLLYLLYYYKTHCWLNFRLKDQNCLCKIWLIQLTALGFYVNNGILSPFFGINGLRLSSPGVVLPQPSSSQVWGKWLQVLNQICLAWDIFLWFTGKFFFYLYLKYKYIGIKNDYFLGI